MEAVEARCCWTVPRCEVSLFFPVVVVRRLKKIGMRSALRTFLPCEVPSEIGLSSDTSDSSDYARTKRRRVGDTGGANGRITIAA